jgi:hypothetical protein
MKSLLTCFLVILIAVSCRKPDDDRGNNGSTRITINNFPDDSDTISVNFHSVLHVSITGAQFPKYVLKVFSQNLLLLKDSSYDGTFQIPTDQLFISTGSYDTRFEFYGGQSGQTFSQVINNGTYIDKRLVVISFSGYNEIPEPVWAEKNGTLEGTITSSQQIKALAVYKFYSSSIPGVRVDSVTATGNGELIFTDHSYVGEKAYYTMKGYSLSDSGVLSYSGSGTANKPLEIPLHVVYSDVNGQPVIKWNKNRYYQDFGSYRIRKKKGYGNSTMIKEIPDINDTVQSGIDLGYPGPVDIYVSHLPKENLQYISPELEMEDYGHMVTYRPGNQFPPFDEFESPRGNDVYLHQGNDPYLYRYSATTYQKLDSIYCPEGRFSVSANNKYVLTIRDDRFHLYNVINGQDISVLISDFLPVANAWDFDVADNGTMAVMNEFDDLKLIDVVHNQLLGTLPFYNGTLNKCQISPTCAYVYVYTEYKNRIYRISGGTFTEVFNTIDVGFNSLTFIADEPDKVLLIRPGKYEIYNLVTGSIEFSAPYTSSQGLSIDFNDHLILSENETNFQIYDLYSGAVLKSIVHNLDYSNYHQTYLHGHTLFNGSGSRMTFQ